MATWRYLSYLISVETPVYGGGQGLDQRDLKSFAAGDSCNTSEWRLPNHLGTHIDFPRHFSPDGKTLHDYPASFWVFQNVAVVDLSPCAEGQIIVPDDITWASLSPDTELLLLKTGFETHRDEDVYWSNNPGIHPDLYQAIRQYTPSVRVLGLDMISASSYSNRDLGREAHTRFLSGSTPVLFLEDMKLSAITQGNSIMEVIVAPLSVAGADGAPCTVLAKMTGS